MEKKVIQYASRDAVQYAQRWALSRNRDYNDFTKGGGDCMNFVSQCLYAGGAAFQKQWV
ncbi:MAG: amidase domain-containing protein [Christensenellales bacterium]